MSLRIKVILPIIVILSAVFLRFYRFESFVTFLGDQGRDAIILKRIVTLEHFPAIGAPSSLGQIFLGPFFYYLIAPFLLIFNFNPVGPAFGVGLLSIVGIIAAYYLVRRETGYFTALVFLTFAGFSFVNIQFSRFAWNPNLLPVFSFLTLYFYFKSCTAKNRLFPVLFGSFLSFSVQLHHLALLLLLPVSLNYIYLLWESKKNIRKVRILNIFISLLSFLFFSLPLVIFDLRHDFLNSRNFLRFFTEGGPADSRQFLSKLLQTNAFFYTHVFQTDFSQLAALFLTVLLIIIMVKKTDPKKDTFVRLNFFTFIFYLVAFSVFNTVRNPHYYNAVYLSFFLVLAWLFTGLSKNKIIRYYCLFLVASAYIFLNFKNLTYLFKASGKSQIKIAAAVAESILQKNPQAPYQTIALPYVETDGHIRYFLEIKGLRPLPADATVEPKELYVLCFDKECKVLGNPQWQIASFKNAGIDKIWTVEGVKIYKLTHIRN